MRLPNDFATALGILILGFGSLAGVLLTEVVGVLAGVVFSLVLVFGSLGVLYSPYLREDEEKEEYEEVGFWRYVKDGILFTFFAWALLLIGYLVFGYRPPPEALTIPLVVGAMAVFFRLIIEDDELRNDAIFAIVTLIRGRKRDPLWDYIWGFEVILWLLAALVFVGCLAAMVMTDALTRLVEFLSELELFRIVY